ncbi:MAG TPA: hypothetical protein VHE55_19505 [Fimbriimonadaceae bacterium]|nr:hypothetical protein [Fimbriimonadaceae bacterium]
MAKRILILLTIFIAAFAGAQGKPASRQAHKERYPTFLLNYSSLQKELGLSPAVVKKIAQIQKDAEKHYLGMISPKPNNPNQLNRPTMQQMFAQQEKRDDAIIALLNEHQRARLKQVGLQYAGPLALGDRSIFATLKITPDQEKKLRAASMKEQKTFTDEIRQATTTTHVSPTNPVSPKQRMEQLTKARIKMMHAFQADAEKILTPAQVTKWKAMLGKPFPVETLYAPLVTKGVR